VSTRRERKTIAATYSRIARALLVISVFHGIGCGGDASDTSDLGAATPPPTASAPVLVPARAAAPEPVTPEVRAPAPVGEDPPRALGLPIPDGIPAPVQALIDDPPQQLDETQFSTLLDHYCVTCHTTPSCSAACDGFLFDDWQHLAAGGNAGPQSIERVLTRVMDRMRDGNMPPDLGGEVYDLPAAPRERMIEFIEAEIARVGNP